MLRARLAERVLHRPLVDRGLPRMEQLEAHRLAHLRFLEIGAGQRHMAMRRLHAAVRRIHVEDAGEHEGRGALAQKPEAVDQPLEVAIVERLEGPVLPTPSVHDEPAG